MTGKISDNEIVAQIGEGRTIELREINTDIVYNSQALSAFDAEFLARSLLVSSAYVSAKAPPIAGKMLGDGVIPIKSLSFEGHKDVNKIVMRIIFPAGIEISVIMPSPQALVAARDLAQSVASTLQSGEPPKTAH